MRPPPLWRAEPAGGRGGAVRRHPVQEPRGADPASRRSGPSTSYVATVQRAGGDLDGFVVTLPKVTSVEQVEAMVARRASRGWLRPGPRFEIQVETPQSILGPDGTALVARMIHAGGERLTGLHYGTYDYSAFCGIARRAAAWSTPSPTTPSW